MKETISKYYRGVIQQGFWYLGLGISGLLLGYLAYRHWGMTGQGILIITLIFAMVQLWKGFHATLGGKPRLRKKISAFEADSSKFIKEEIRHLTTRATQHEQLKTFLTVAFLAGMLCLLMGAFGNWSELMLGVGAALAAEGAIQLILELLANYRDSFYLLRLQKVKPSPDAEK